MSVEISNIGAVKVLVETALTKGVTDVILSPGSRNAPIIISFNAIDDFDCISVVDERTAGFMALGMSQQIQKPVILSCTSGSALLNYGPAIAEAYHQNIPLIILAADRPIEWIGQGEGQSINQTNVLQGVLAHTAELIKERSEDDRWYNTRLAQQAFELAILEKKPVLINVPLSEPLYETEEWNKSTLKSINLTSSKIDVEALDLKALQETWSNAKRIMILVTQNQEKSGLIDHLKRVYDDNRVAILTETTANVYHFGFISCIDRTLARVVNHEREDEFVPDILITIGGNIISKKLKAFLRKHKARISHHWHFGNEMLDTFQVLTHQLTASPSFVLNQMPIQSISSEQSFGNLWKGAFFKSEESHANFLPSAPFSDLKIFEIIMDMVPSDWMIQMGNSSVVRYIQLFNQLQGVSYHGNRGVSGIEGCTSTAVGAAMKTHQNVLFISGDHAFRYDSNGLSFEQLPENLKIIVVNNEGGNIFRIIDGPSSQPSSEQYIEHSQHKSIKGLVEYHGVNYCSASDIDSFEHEIVKLVDGTYTGCTVLEVFTPRLVSPEVLKSYFKAIELDSEVP